MTIEPVLMAPTIFKTIIHVLRGQSPHGNSIAERDVPEPSHIHWFFNIFEKNP
jgi:hypothetical protein